MQALFGRPLALLETGIREMLKEAENNGIIIDASDYYSPCGVCRAIIEAVIK